MAPAAGLAVDQLAWDQLDQLHQQHSIDESMSGLVYIMMQAQAIHRVLGESMVSVGLTAEGISEVVRRHAAAGLSMRTLNETVRRVRPEEVCRQQSAEGVGQQLQQNEWQK